MNEYMKLAKEQANKGMRNLEGGPFGAVITDKEGNIISVANNKEVYFACTRKDAGNIGFRDDAIYEFLETNNKNLLDEKQIDREECIQLFEEYKKLNGEIY